MFRLSALICAASVFAVPLLATQASAGLIFADGFESPVVTHIPAASGDSGGYDNYGSGAALGPWTVVGPAGRADAVSVITTDFTQNGISFPAQSGKQWADLAGQDSNGTEGVQIQLSGFLNKAYTVSFWVGNVVDPSLVFRAPEGNSGVYLLELRAGRWSTTVPFMVQAKERAITPTRTDGRAASCKLDTSARLSAQPSSARA